MIFLSFNGLWQFSCLDFFFSLAYKLYFSPFFLFVGQKKIWRRELLALFFFRWRWSTFCCDLWYFKTPCINQTVYLIILFNDVPKPKHSIRWWEQSCNHVSGLKREAYLHIRHYSSLFGIPVYMFQRSYFNMEKSFWTFSPLIQDY